MAQVVFRPSDYYSTRGLGLRVDVDEHFNWAGSWLLSDPAPAMVTGPRFLDLRDWFER